MSHSINQEITPGGLLKFAAPSIVMMVFMSLYTIVDGIFVSRFLGSNALSSVNIVYPVISVAVALSTMLGTGGSAIISKYLGEGKKKRAREALTQFVVLALLFSFGLLIFSEMFLTPISRFLGASDVLLADCRRYLGASMLFVPACMLQAVFQSFLVTAGHPGLGLLLMTGAGIVNIVLDYMTIVHWQMGIAPLIGFQYGAGNRVKLRKIYWISFLAVAISSVVIAAVAICFSPAVVSVFTKEPRTFELASVGFRLFPVNFLFSGMNIASSGFFTALSNGKVSALISFSQTLVFIVLSLLTLPRILGITGVWIAVPVAEFLTLLVSGWMHRRYFWRTGEENYLQS